MLGVSIDCCSIRASNLDVHRRLCKLSCSRLDLIHPDGNEESRLSLLGQNLLSSLIWGSETYIQHPVGLMQRFPQLLTCGCLEAPLKTRSVVI